LGTGHAAKIADATFLPICYNGLPHIYPQNCPFPWDDLNPDLICDSLDAPNPPSKTASRSNQLFFLTERQMVRCHFLMQINITLTGIYYSLVLCNQLPKYSNKALNGTLGLSVMILFINRLFS